MTRVTVAVRVKPEEEALIFPSFSVSSKNTAKTRNKTAKKATNLTSKANKKQRKGANERNKEVSEGEVNGDDNNNEEDNEDDDDNCAKNQNNINDNIDNKEKDGQKEGDEEAGKVELTVNQSKHVFRFDMVLGMKTSQEEVFSSVCTGVLSDVLEGFHGTIFAYGQTGAGKTYTVMGPPVESYDSRGLCLRTIDFLFQSIRRKRDRDYIVKLSAIEIYNDNITDLLREGKPEDSPKLVIMDTPEGVMIPALSQFPVSAEDEAYGKISEANLNRAVAEHQLNRRSSRSHVIYSFYLTFSLSVQAGDVVQSKLHLVDLAGSERIEKSGSTGGLAKEATHINKSLTFLEQVVLSLTKQAQGGASSVTVASYRQSKLTYILKDSLGGNCNTLLIGCIWPHKNHIWETLSTLRFATRMKCIENHPKRNSLVTGNNANSTTRSLQNTIESLKRELAMRDTIHAYNIRSLSAKGGNSAEETNVYLDSLTASQQKSALDVACEYASRGGEVSSDLEVHSFAQAQGVCAALRNALWLACGGDPQLVEDALKSMKLSKLGHSSASHSPLKPRDQPTTSQDCPDSPEPREQLPTDQNPQNDGKETVPVTVPTTVPVTDTATTVTEENAVDLTRREAPTDPFERFKQAEGATLHSQYEAAKSRIKELKAAQKQLAVSVNSCKADIDEQTAQLSDLQAESPAESSALREAVAAAKGKYRERRAELLACKEELAAAQVEKQACLKVLVEAFEQFSANEAL